MKWQVMHVDLDDRNALSKKLGVPPIIATLLLNRGLDTEDKVREYLEPKLDDLYSPWGFSRMEELVDDVRKSIEAGDKIVVWGDADADGRIATVVLMTVLRYVGADVDYFIPDRYKKGFGLNREDVELLASKGVRFIITVDCATNNKEIVDEAVQRWGMKVWVTDHHLPTGKDVVDKLINPHVDSYPYEYLVGSGVAYKVAQAIATKLCEMDDMTWYERFGHLMFITALGTIADKGYLLGENRTLVKLGLERGEALRHMEGSPFAYRMMAERGTTYMAITNNVLPVINARDPDIAEGRDLVVEYFLTDERRAVIEILGRLEFLAQSWMRRLNFYLKSLSEFVDNSSRVVFLAHEDIPANLVGPLANKLREMYDKSAIVIGENGKGEVRAVEGVNFFNILKEIQHMFSSFGGHPEACGFTTHPKLVPDVKRAILERVPLTSHRVVLADAEFMPKFLTTEIFNYIKKMQPFGKGNPPPMFVAYRQKFNPVEKGVFIGKHFFYCPKEFRKEGYWDILYKITDRRELVIIDARSGDEGSTHRA